MFTLKNLFFMALALGGIYVLIRTHKAMVNIDLSGAPDLRANTPLPSPLDATTAWYSPLKFMPRTDGWYDVRERVADYGTKGDPYSSAWWDGAQWRSAPNGEVCAEQNLWFRGLFIQA